MKFSVILFTALWTINEGCLSLNGIVPDFNGLSSPRRSGTFQSPQLIVSPGLRFTCSGQVVSWQAYMEVRTTYDSLIFQVWRPQSDGCSYSLQGTHRIQNYRVGNDYLVDTSSVTPALPPIAVVPGDIVSIYVVNNVGQSSRVGVQQYSGDRTVVYVSNNNPGNVAVVNFCGGGTSVQGAPIMNAVVVAAPTTDPTTGFIPETTTSLTTTAGVTTTASPNAGDTTTLSPFTGDTTIINPGTTTLSPGTDGTTTIISPDMTTLAPDTGDTTTLSPDTTSTNPDIMDTTNIIPDTADTTNTTTNAGDTTNQPITTKRATDILDTVASSQPADVTTNTNISDNSGGQNSTFPLYASGVIGALVTIVILLGCILSVYCCAVRRRAKAIQPNHSLFHQRSQLEHDYDAHKIHLKSYGKNDYEESGIYAEVGPPATMAESNLDFSSSSQDILKMPEQNMEYEIPVSSKGQASDMPPQRSNAYEVPINAQACKPHASRDQMTKQHPWVKKKSQLEVSNVYETPADATKKGDSKMIQTNPGIYDVPMDGVSGRPQHQGSAKAVNSTAGRTGAQDVCIGGDDDTYTPMASILNYVHSALSDKDSEET